MDVWNYFTLQGVFTVTGEITGLLRHQLSDREGNALNQMEANRNKIQRECESFDICQMYIKINIGLTTR